MVSLTERCRGLIIYLLEQNEKVNIKEIAGNFNVSSRTIRYDLDIIEDWLAEKNIKLIRKSRVGVWIEDVEEARNLLNINSKDENYIRNYVFTGEERVNIILNLLFQNNEYLSTGFIGDKLGVSRSTIFKDLLEVEKWLKNRDINIEKKPNKGIRLKASEENLRRGFLDYINLNFDRSKILDFLKQNQSSKYKSKFKFLLDYQIKGIFSEIDFEDIENVILCLEDELEMKFVDTAFAGLLIHIAIAIKRLKSNEKIEMPIEQLDSLKNTKEFNEAKKVLVPIQEKYNIKIPDSEIGYIVIHILGARFRDNIVGNNDMQDKSDDALIKIKIDQFIEQVGNTLHYDLGKDHELKRGLFVHIKPAIVRMQYNLKSTNPLLADIKGNFESVFNVCKEKVIIFEEEFDIQFNHHEIGYITMHIASAIERLKEPKNNESVKVIVVCSSGIGTASMISSRIQSEFPYVEIICQCSLFEISAENVYNADFIISTIPINNTLTKPIIYVSPLLSKKDVDNLKEAFNNCDMNFNDKKINKIDIDELISVIGKNCTIEDKKMLIEDLTRYFNFDKKIHCDRQKPRLMDYLNKDTILCNIEVDDFDNALFKTAYPLQKKGNVKKAYLDKMLKLGKLMPDHFFLKERFIMPHADNEGDVDKSSMSLGILKNPVYLGEEKFDVILILAADDTKVHERALEELLVLLDDDKIVMKLTGCKDSNEVIDLIGNVLQG